jgi:hypothetical protein
MPSADEEVALVCTRCGTLLEVCAFCERDDCAHMSCYRCLRVDLGQSMDHPHEHGG